MSGNSRIPTFVRTKSRRACAEAALRAAAILVRSGEAMLSMYTMHAHRFGMNFEETIVGKLTEVYQTVHLKEFTDFPKKDEKDPTKVFTDIHFKKKSAAHEAYHLSHHHDDGFCQ